MTRKKLPLTFCAIEKIAAVFAVLLVSAIDLSSQITFFYHADSPDSIWTWEIRGGQPVHYFPDSAHAKRTVRITTEAAYELSQPVASGFRMDCCMVAFCPVTIGYDSSGIKLVPDTEHIRINEVIRKIMCEPGAYIEIFNYTSEDYDSLTSRGFDNVIPMPVEDPWYFDKVLRTMRRTQYTIIRNATYQCVLYQDQLLFEGERKKLN